jgi:hypothetical protein
VSLPFLYAITDDELEKLIDEDGLEGIDKDFRNIPGSDTYINQFSLNDDEIKMIGVWGFGSDFWRKSEPHEYGAGLCIAFFPNRYFKVDKGYRENGQIQSTYGMWKIENKILFVKFEAKLVVINYHARNEYERFDVEYYEDGNYYPIFQIHDYKKVFYNEEAFKWDAIPSKMREFYEIFLEDAPRMRRLFYTLGMSSLWGIDPDSKPGKTLLHPQKTKEYYVDLFWTWTT